MRISVVLKDWMPDSREVNIAPNMRPVDFQLRPGRKLRIRFVDRAGLPSLAFSFQSKAGAAFATSRRT